MSDKSKQCKCESCRRSPQWHSLLAKATPEERECMDWLFAAYEDTGINLVFANKKSAAKDSEIDTLTVGKQAALDHYAELYKESQAKDSELTQLLSKIRTLVDDNDRLKGEVEQLKNQAVEIGYDARLWQRAVKDGIEFVECEDPDDPFSGGVMRKVFAWSDSGDESVGIPPTEGWSTRDGAFIQKQARIAELERQLRVAQFGTVAQV